MAHHLTAKAPTEVAERRWTVPVDADDAPASVSLDATGVTVDAEEFEGNDLVLTLSAGTAGSIASIVATVTTDQSRVIVETLYVPIITSDATIAPTGNDVCAFALRKITGNGVDAEATELADALERLNMMLAAWRKQGADTGVTLPVLSTSSLTIPDEFVEAIKFNLRNRLHRHYGVPLDADDMMEARRGLQLVKAANLPSEREGASYY
jgi:hypothetical protein